MLNSSSHFHKSSNHVFEHVFLIVQVQNRCNELEERLHQTQQSLATTQQENQDLKTAAEDANTKQQVVGLFS
jgi:hypothetical protein